MTLFNKDTIEESEKISELNNAAYRHSDCIKTEDSEPPSGKMRPHQQQVAPLAVLDL